MKKMFSKPARVVTSCPLKAKGRTPKKAPDDFRRYVLAHVWATVGVLIASAIVAGVILMEK